MTIGNSEEFPLARFSRKTLSRPELIASSIVAGFTVAGLILRLPGMGDWSLYRDDAWQALAAHGDTLGEVLMTGLAAPGYAAFLWLWSHLLGSETVTLLLPALVSGVLLAPAAAVLARKVGASLQGGVVASALLASSHVALAYSSRIKPNVLEAWFTIILVLVFLEVLRKRTNSNMAATLVLAIAALLFSTASVPVALAGFAAVGAQAWRWRQGRFGITVIIAMYLSTLALWYMAVLDPAVTQVLREWWSGKYLPSFGNWLLSPAAALHGLVAGLSPLTGGSAGAIALATGLSGLFLAGGIHLARRKAWHGMAMVVGPIVVAFVFALMEGRPLGTGRTDLYLYPLLAAGVALGLDQTTRELGARRNDARALLLASVLGVLFVSLARPAAYPQDAGRELVAEVNQRMGSEEAVVALPETSYLWAWYSSDEVSIRRDQHSMTGFTPMVTDDHVLLLPGFEMYSYAQANQRARTTSLNSVERMISMQSPAGVWTVMATSFRVEPFPELDRLLFEMGYDRTEVIEHWSGNASRWQQRS